jgi:DDE superfamily endonuclease
MNSQYVTDQIHTMDGQKRILDLKYHQMKVKSGVRAVGFSDHATNPRKREKLNGLLAVEAVSGAEFLRLVPIAKTEDVALYFGELCKECIQERIKHLTIILDNNSTHKDKLRRYLWAELFTSGIDEQITVEFVYTPPYSPNFNLVEYLIHSLRLRLLHHLPSGISIEQVEMRLLTFFKTQQLQTPIQISNTIQHTYIQPYSIIF